MFAPPARALDRLNFSTNSELLSFFTTKYNPNIAYNIIDSLTRAKFFLSYCEAYTRFSDFLTSGWVEKSFPTLNDDKLIFLCLWRDEKWLYTLVRAEKNDVYELVIVHHIIQRPPDNSRCVSVRKILTKSKAIWPKYRKNQATDEAPRDIYEMLFVYIFGFHAIYQLFRVSAGGPKPKQRQFGWG